MPLARDLTVIKQLGFERLAHQRGAVTTHAYQPYAAARQSLDRRDADLPLQAFGYDLALVETKVNSPAHDNFRLAAAKASLTFE